MRAWHIELLRRLGTAGYIIGVELSSSPIRARIPLDFVLRAEAWRFGASLASRVPAPQPAPLAGPQLLIDLTGQPARTDTPMLQLAFNGHPAFAYGLVDILAAGTLPVITTRLNGREVGVARPMLSDRLWLSRAGNEVLAGALSLVEQSVARFFAEALAPVDVPQPRRASTGFWRHYLPHLAKGIATRARQKLGSRRPFYWQVGYRLIDGPGIAAAGALDGVAFTTLADDHHRFYADPFVFEHQGRTYLFVEEYPYSTAKGVISVAELGTDGHFGVPRVVLEEPYHLSYPQVFTQGGEIFMLPESGAARRLVLYRAAAFPDQWLVDTVLMADTDINDATLLEREGRFWLFGTERRGSGSASDTLVVFTAPDLRGPWTPHKLNPIAIDRSAARPGGAFVQRDGRIFLPAQDGQWSYGGGLGLMELLRLDDDAVVFAPPVPVRAGSAWNRQGIHTLNRAGRIEAVDSAG